MGHLKIVSGLLKPKAWVLADKPRHKQSTGQG